MEAPIAFLEAQVPGLGEIMAVELFSWAAIKMPWAG